MKTFITFITLVTLAISAGAQGSVGTYGFSSYAVSGTALNAGTNYAIISQQSRNNGEPILTYLNVNSLFTSTSSSFQSYISTNRTVALAANSTTSLHIASTNGLVAGQWVVITHQGVLARVQNEAAIISSVSATGTNIVLQTSPVTAVAAGDLIKAETAWTSIPLTSSLTAREINAAGGGIVSGQRDEPMLLTAISLGAGTNSINAVNAVFAP